MECKLISDYVNFWFNLNDKLIYENYISFFSKKKNYSKFIREFPELKRENIDIIIEYIKKYNDSIEPIKILNEHLNKENLYKILECLNIHKENILELIDNNNSIEVKKKIYLGLIWFGLGFYISYFVTRILEYKNNYHFFSINEVPKNKYIIFLTASFIFYDSIFDDNKLELKAKKICIDYTKYFLKYLIESTITDETTNSLFEKYLLHENIKYNDLNKEYKLIIDKSNKILGVLLGETKKEKNLNKLQSIYDLFISEIITSKIQHNTNNINEEEIVKCTIYKSTKSIKAIIQCIVGNLDFKKDIILNEKIHLFAFLTQLLDDFNDIQIDKKEKNRTIFSFKTDNNTYNENNINKLLNYIYYLKNDLDNEYSEKDLINVNNYLILFIFNYALSKYENKEYLLKLKNYVPFKKEDVFYLREKKNKMINDYNLKDKIIDL